MSNTEVKKKPKKNLGKVKQEDVSSIIPDNTIIDMETVHSTVLSEGSIFDAPTSQMNDTTGILNKKVLVIPSSMKDAPTSSVEVLQNDIIPFEGTLTPYYYTKKVFLNQFQSLFFSFFSIQLPENHITIYESTNQITYNISDFTISSQDLYFIHQKLTKQILVLPTPFFSIMQDLESFYKDHFKTKKEIIYISQNIMKFKKDKHNPKKFQLDENGNKIPYYPYQYHLCEKRDIHRLLDSLQTNQHLNEIIRSNIPVKPYFDLEIEESIPDDEKTMKLHSFIMFYIQEIQQLYDIQLDFKDIVILDSNTPVKLSYHLVVNDKIYFLNNEHQNIFMNYLWVRFNNPRDSTEKQLFDSLSWFKIDKNGISEKRLIFDISVYTRDRAIRMVNQSKAGKTACLKIISDKHTIVDSLIQYDLRFDSKHRLCIDDLPQLIKEKTVKTTKSLKTIIPKTISSTVVQSQDENEEDVIVDQTIDPHLHFAFTGNTLKDKYRLSDAELASLKKDYLIYLYVIPIQNSYREWIKIGMALKKCNAPVEDWIEWSRLGDSFKEGECEYYYERFHSSKDSTIDTPFGNKITGYTFKTLRHLAYRSYPKLFTGFVSIYRQLYNLDLKGIEKRVQTTKYLCETGSPNEFDYATDKKFVIILACMGKGKSQLIHRVLQNPELKRCLYLSARQTFAYSTKGEFQHFTNYIGESSESISKSDNIIISLESLLKIPEEAVFDLIVCDEIETLLMNFSSETMNRKTYEIFQRFKRLIQDSKQTFFMDAFISNRSISFVKNQSRLFRNEYIDILFLENTTIHHWVPARKISYDESSSFPFIYEQIQKGKKLYITFGSNRKMLLMRHHFGLDGAEDAMFPLEKSFADKVLTYNKSTASVEMENLIYINDTWKSASLVATTPKITVGCNFSPEGDSSDPEFDMKVCLGVHSCTARDMFQSLMRVRHVGNDGLYYATGFNLTNHFEKNFLTLDAFNTYEDEKRAFILEELQKRKRERQEGDSVKSKYDRCLDINAMIEYIEKNKPDPELRSILYFNSLEYSLSSRYYKEYFETLLPLAGFRKINDEVTELPTEEKTEETETEKITVSRIIMTHEDMENQYSKIPIINQDDKDRLEKRQMKMISNNDENIQLEKYFFLQIINSEITPLRIQALLFYQVWMEPFLRKKLLNEVYYQKDYEEVLLKETNDAKCTEKIGNIAEKLSIIREIEKWMKWKHGDLEQVITPEDLRNTGDYFKTNHDKIHKIFKLRDKSKKKEEENKIPEMLMNNKYCLNMVNKIFKEFNGYSLLGTSISVKDKKSEAYKMVSSIPFYKFTYLTKKENVEKKIESFFTV